MVFVHYLEVDKLALLPIKVIITLHSEYIIKLQKIIPKIFIIWFLVEAKPSGVVVNVL